jgi:hypothetical protein
MPAFQRVSIATTGDENARFATDRDRSRLILTENDAGTQGLPAGDFPRNALICGHFSAFVADNVPWVFGEVGRSDVRRISPIAISPTGPTSAERTRAAWRSMAVAPNQGTSTCRPSTSRWSGLAAGEPQLVVARSYDVSSSTISRLERRGKAAQGVPVDTHFLLAAQWMYL